jgi:hypothetical protein
MFRMHGTIFGAANRGESGIVTCYDFPSEAKKPGFINVSHLHSRVGMQVSLREGPADKPKPAGWAQKFKRLTGGPRPRRLIPATAAAIILMAVALILFSPVADGRIALGQVYQAIANIRNVCISRFLPGRTDPTRIEYVSKPLSSKLFVLEDRIVLRDLEKLVVKTKILATGEVTTMPIPPDKLIEFTESLEGTFGLVPFPEIRDVPEDAQWTRVHDADVEGTSTDTQVYDLTWRKAEAGITYDFKWRAFIDVRTKLPKRTETYHKQAIEGEYTLKSVYVVSCPNDSEIWVLIGEAFE